MSRFRSVLQRLELLSMSSCSPKNSTCLVSGPSGRLVQNVQLSGGDFCCYWCWASAHLSHQCHDGSGNIPGSSVFGVHWGRATNVEFSYGSPHVCCPERWRTTKCYRLSEEDWKRDNWYFQKAGMIHVKQCNNLVAYCEILQVCSFCGNVIELRGKKRWELMNLRQKMCKDWASIAAAESRSHCWPCPLKRFTASQSNSGREFWPMWTKFFTLTFPPLNLLVEAVFAALSEKYSNIFSSDQSTLRVLLMWWERARNFYSSSKLFKNTVSGSLIGTTGIRSLSSSSPCWYWSVNISTYKQITQSKSQACPVQESS